MEALKSGSDVLFVLLGGIMVLAMHAGFAFLELGTVRKKNQVNALVKILTDFSVSTIAYFFIGYSVAYGVSFFSSAEVLSAKNGYDLVKFFFLLTFAAAIPAIVSGGIAERARFNPQLAATFALVGLVYPFYEGIVWNGNYGIQDWLEASFGARFHDFAGSVVVHAMGGWIALPAVLLLGARRGRYTKDGMVSAHPPSNIPFLALGAWILTVGWFGFNVMSAQLDRGGVGPGGGQLADGDGGRHAGRAGDRPQRPRLHPQRPAGRAGGHLRGIRSDASDRGARHRRDCRRAVRLDVHGDAEPLEDRRRAGRVAAAWPVRRVGRHRSRHFRQPGAGRHGWRQPGGAVDRHAGGVAVATLGSLIVYGSLKWLTGLRLDAEAEFTGADLSIHKVSATAERETNW
jgi:ammonium transporter, Amt family